MATDDGDELATDGTVIHHLGIEQVSLNSELWGDPRYKQFGLERGDY